MYFALIFVNALLIFNKSSWAVKFVKAKLYNLIAAEKYTIYVYFLFL